jgi:hypothetical protein
VGTEPTKGSLHIKKGLDGVAVIDEEEAKEALQARIEPGGPEDRSSAIAFSLEFPCEGAPVFGLVALRLSRPPLLALTHFTTLASWSVEH